jgi:broad specificity phosphatase PhoE
MKEGLALDHVLVKLQWRDRSGISPASSFHLRVQVERSCLPGCCQGVHQAPRGSLSPSKTPLASRLTLISHAATEAQRRAAFPLNEALGDGAMEKVSALRWNAPRAHRTLSAPELRAQQTAQALGLSADVDSELRDCDYGAWSGRDLSEVGSGKPEEVALWLRDPGAAPHGGESIVDLIDRVGRWLGKQREGGHTLAITHPAVIRAAVVCALEAPPQTFWRIDIAPLSTTDLRWNDRVWTLRCSGCALPVAASLGN